jgi:hypothetical protein
MGTNRKYALSLLIFSLILLSIFVALGASITKTWTNNWLSDSSVGSSIDDQVNNLSTAIQEREQNGGRYWPLSNDSKSGINTISSSNFVSNEWAVYKTDLTSKALVLTDSAFTVNATTSLGSTLSVVGDTTLTGSVTAANDLTVNGNFNAPNDKRVLIASISGRGDGNAPDVENAAFYMPQGLSGTVVEFEASNNSTFNGGSATLRRLTTTWDLSSSRSLEPCNSGATEVATLNFTSAGDTHRRTTTIVSPTINSSDILCIDRSSNIGGYTQFNIYIRLDW